MIVPVSPKVKFGLLEQRVGHPFAEVTRLLKGFAYLDFNVGVVCG
jgi:hypothetical protein